MYDRSAQSVTVIVMEMESVTCDEILDQGLYASLPANTLRKGMNPPSNYGLIIEQTDSLASIK